MEPHAPPNQDVPPWHKNASPFSNDRLVLHDVFHGVEAQDHVGGRVRDGDAVGFVTDGKRDGVNDPAPLSFLLGFLNQSACEIDPVNAVGAQFVNKKGKLAHPASEVSHALSGHIFCRKVPRELVPQLKIPPFTIRWLGEGYRVECNIAGSAFPQLKRPVWFLTHRVCTSKVSSLHSKPHKHR
jgi:hypothetical protein